MYCMHTVNEDWIMVLQNIKSDCFKLKKTNQLTEYGHGQLDLIMLIEKNLTLPPDKYTVADLKKIPPESRTAASNLKIANELHNIAMLLSGKNDFLAHDK